MIPIVLYKAGSGYSARLSGKSSPILRPVPGNTHPASAAWWPDREAATAGLRALLGEFQIVREES